MGHPLLRGLLTAAFSAMFYLIVFQAIGPVLIWPNGPAPAPTGSSAGVYFLIVIVIFAAGFAMAEIIKLDARAGYIKKPKLVVEGGT